MTSKARRSVRNSGPAKPVKSPPSKTVRPAQAKRQRLPSKEVLQAAIGANVRVRRLKLGWTVAHLAERAGMTAGMLSKIENGQISPSLVSLHRTAHALGASMAVLLDGL